MALSSESNLWGAEAVIYIGEFLGRKVVIKKRRSKQYRHPVYDTIFIQTRTRNEAKILAELYAAGLKVPAPLLVDVEKGALVMEYIEGERLSEKLANIEARELVEMAWDIGRQSALMHNRKIYHGDLTIANIIYSGRGVYIIDFGLAGYSTDIEEHAIDIHLLQKSIYSLYPHLLKPFMESYFKAYREYYSGSFDEIMYKLREISTRGRYIDRELRRSVMRERYVG
ncbi:Kae1-associated kinase Bud32 [Desulfurococcus amylolyticus]|uniref:Kae1-associated kinase Bud32 n=1 Tax=Desulfurococcus amylolyticus TaxID=94694 RepID=UPI0005B212D7|nr:Kae1-associated kinase Bud32 [Desulfurococcus amylolyticus]